MSWIKRATQKGGKRERKESPRKNQHFTPSILFFYIYVSMYKEECLFVPYEFGVCRSKCKKTSHGSSLGLKEGREGSLTIKGDE